MREEPWLIVDTETSGVREPIHVVEIAAQRMRGWERDGAPFSILLNHDVPIEPAAEAVHGYSRDYLRRHGERPLFAHEAFRHYAGNLPVVAYNLAYDWNRALEPEYRRLGVADAGQRGFCAMTLARRTINATGNYKLETLKSHFRLGDERSHLGANDVEVLVRLFEKVLAPRLYQAGLVGFATVAAFSRRTPVAVCQEHVFGVGDPAWHVLDMNDCAQGPFHSSAIGEFAKGGPIYVWREGMTDWVLTSELPEFTPPAARKRGARKKRAASPWTPEGCPPGTTMRPASTTAPDLTANAPLASGADRNLPRQAHRAADAQRWADELVGLCQGILADGVINTAELRLLQEWLMTCPYAHLFPISVLAEIVEEIAADGIVTPDELNRLKNSVAMMLESC